MAGKPAKNMSTLPPPATGSGEFNTASIILAEDQKINQKLMHYILSEAGYRVEIADNGIEAVDKFFSAPDSWDLILMDLQMPDLDGLTATRLIRSKGHADIPIIALTAHAMTEKNASMPG